VPVLVSILSNDATAIFAGYRTTPFQLIRT